MKKNSQGTVSQVERIKHPTPEVFQQKLLSPRKPVIITGAMHDWNTIFLWTPDYFNKVIDEREIDVSVSQNRIFSGTLESGFAKLRRKMNFSDFLKSLLQESESLEHSYYLQQQLIPTVFPELVQDIKVPDYFERKRFIDPMIWIGCGQNICPLHYDMMDNLFAQVSGRKRFLLFDPNQTSLLSPFPAYSEISHLSQVNIENPNFEKFPNFRKAGYYECTLEAGEILFLPVFWWHQVSSFLKNVENHLNISVNFWSKPPLVQFLSPPGRRSVAKIPRLLKSTPSL